MFFSGASKDIVFEEDVVTRFLFGFPFSYFLSQISLCLSSVFSVAVGEGWSRGLPTRSPWFRDIGLYRGHEERVVAWVLFAKSRFAVMQLRRRRLGGLGLFGRRGRGGGVVPAGLEGAGSRRGKAGGWGWGAAGERRRERKGKRERGREREEKIEKGEEREGGLSVAGGWGWGRRWVATGERRRERKGKREKKRERKGKREKIVDGRRPPGARRWVTGGGKIAGDGKDFRWEGLCEVRCMII
ncbi:hypothetical protein TIFTF001_045010 [Ficus carica]|uniref:Uncharacterized protein n=1 Tax=Ficus carica TaxID=3494 RepID=A0AA88A744_FICCA|nr:hypothetical protein TIFTF001_045010 [Ficus carica]